ncbi:MAG: type I methionyl aminopeptidase [Bacteroidetes bacterium]|nr:type I methionyl aminopeptidase [Bacteroidota bacterium]
MAIRLNSNEDIEMIRLSADLLSRAHAEVTKAIKVGVTGLELDKIAEEFILDNGGKPSFKGFHGFPATLCLSLNSEVVHGIPKKAPLKDGDVVSVDCGVILNGWYSDMAYTYGLGNVKPEVQDLIRVTKESLALGIAQAAAGKRTGDIGFAVQELCEVKNPYKCVRELVGHGVGKGIHEDPQVPNYGRRGDGTRLPENCVICIEPMVNLGKKGVYTAKDDWTIVTQDHKPSAHFEHTLAVKVGGPDILSTFKYIEEAMYANPELVKI